MTCSSLLLLMLLTLKSTLSYINIATPAGFLLEDSERGFREW